MLKLRLLWPPSKKLVSNFSSQSVTAGLNAIYHDEYHGIFYKIMTPREEPNAVSVVANAFFQGEPMSSQMALKWTYDDWLKFMQIFSKHQSEQELSVVALEEHSGDVIGSFLCEDFATPYPDSFIEFLNEDQSRRVPFAECLGELNTIFLKNRGYSGLCEVPKGKILHLFNLGVSNRFRKRSIGYNMTKLSLKNAKNRGFESAVIECTGAFSRRIMTLPEFGGNIEHFADYSTWEYNGAKVFEKVANETPHKGMTLITFDL